MRFSSPRYYGTKTTHTSAEEIAHFNALASSWWDVNGPQRILHKMNLLRMDFIHQTLRQHLQLNEKGTPLDDEVYIPPYNVDLLPHGVKLRILEEQEARRDELLAKSRLRALDVGCGGGILLELLARLPFIGEVKGIDLSSDVLEAAKVHSTRDPAFSGGKLSYELSAVEDLPKDDVYDVVTLFEVLEHVEYPSSVMTEALSRVKPGGWLFLSTINRDFVSWFTTIFMGEHVLGIVPVGTHTLEKYIDQKEIRQWVAQGRQYRVADARGCVYLPAYGWKFTENANVGNYFMAIQRVD